MAMSEHEISLVHASKGGDSRAFEELYGLYYIIAELTHTCSCRYANDVVK